MGRKRKVTTKQCAMTGKYDRLTCLLIEAVKIFST